MLELKYFTKSYDDVVFSNLHLTFPSVGLIFIKGYSGCGKSTLLNCIAGIENVDDGELYYNYQLIKSDKEFYSFRKNHLSYLLQDFNLIDDLTVEENINLETNNTQNNLEYYLNLFNLKILKKTKVKYLSGGEKQRLSLIKILMANKDILLLDEPTSCLDNDNASIVYEVLKKLSLNKLIIVVCHNNEFVDKYADDIYDLTKKEHNLKQYNIIQFNNNIKDVKYSKCLFLGIKIFKRKMGRSVLSSVCFIFVMIFLMCTLIFDMSMNNFFQTNVKNYIDNNVIYISEVTKENINDSSLSIVKQNRPEYYLIKNLVYEFEANVYYSLQGIFNKGIVYCENEVINCLIKPVFKNQEILNNKNEFFCNQAFYKQYMENNNLNINLEIITYDQYFNRAIDHLNFKTEIKVVDIVDEFEFMMVPTLYYSYNTYFNYFSSYTLENASKLLNKHVSLFDRLSLLANHHEEITNYELIIVSDDVVEIKNKLNSNYQISSNYLDNKENLETIFDSISMILKVFSAMAFLTALILISISVYSIVYELKKDLALFFLNGYSQYKIYLIYVFYGLIISIVSYITSLILLPYILDIINYLLNKYFGFYRFMQDIKIKNNAIIFNFFIVFSLLGIISSLVPSYLIGKNKINIIMKDEL